MIQSFVLLLAAFLVCLSSVYEPSALAQSNSAERFARYCDQLATPAPSNALEANVKVGSLMAVVDATNGTDKLMREAIARNLDYGQFKTEMRARKISLNDQFHEAHYATAARAKCETTESGAGDMNTQAHNSPTDEQLMRKVNDSGIGVDQMNDTGTGVRQGPGTGTGETDQ